MTWLSENRIPEHYVSYVPGAGQGGRQLRINPEGLPEPHRTNFFRNRADEQYKQILEQQAEADPADTTDWRNSPAFKALAPFQRAYVSRWMVVLTNFGHLSGGKGSPLDVELQRYSAATGQSYTWKTFYRNRKLFAEGGIAALAPQHGLHRRGESKLHPFDVELYKKLWLSENAPNHKAVYALVRAEAQKQGRDVSRFPHPESFRKAIYKEVTPSERYRMRHGYRAWQRKYGGYVQRSVKELPAGAIWVGDNRPLDVWCVDADLNGGRPFRPMLSAWIDFKSRFWVSHEIYQGSPNADWQVQTLKWAMEDHGLPGEGIYIDNGKDYVAKDFLGIISILGLKYRNALPYNADAKVIEPMFRRQIEKVEKFLTGYTGRNSEHKPEYTSALLKKSRKAAHKGQPQPAAFIPFSELKALVSGYLHTANQTPWKSGPMKHKTPEQVFHTAQDGSARQFQQIRPGTLDLLCMPVAEKKICRNGVFCEKQKAWYWAPELEAEKGRTITYRRDPRLPGEIHVFLNGRALCKAELQSEIHGWAETPEERAELHKRLERIRREEKRLAKMAKEMGFRYTPAELGERLEIDARIEREQLHRAGKGPAADTEYKPIRRMANHASDGMAAEFKRLEQRDMPDAAEISRGRALAAQAEPRWEELSMEQQMEQLSDDLYIVCMDQPPALRREFLDKYAKPRYLKRGLRAVAL